MTRIIGGHLGGRRIATPAGEATRPTSDRVREALFSAIESWAPLTGLRFLDLYAGSGAVGLEAASRGAARVTLVERDRRTAELIRRNARTLDCSEAEVLAASVSAVLTGPPAVPYDVVFADPPYPMADAEVEAVLGGLVDHGWLACDALVVVERSSRGSAPAWPVGITGRRTRRYGETALHYGHAESTEPPEE